MNETEFRTIIERQLALSRQLKEKIQRLESPGRGKIAVVGMALRFPGNVSSPEGYWEFLLNGEDGVSEIPSNRSGLRRIYRPGSKAPGTSYVSSGGFLADVADFDAEFFGMSAKEAETLDPQQRLLLETAWESLERAGIVVQRSERQSVGVFVGIMASDYADRLTSQPGSSGPNAYFGTSRGYCFASGRISHTFGFSGPAMSIDTACSSSLAAIHLARQNLLAGSCRYAIAGGANLVISPDLMVSLCQTGALAPDGRCKTFSDQADGYGRGEGVGTVVLMRLEDALQEGRPVLAVLRSSASNHDGAASGLTVPSGPAQEEVIRRALRIGKVAGQDVGYVETHGTGTELGDPIEVGALSRALCSAERTTPLLIGSVKPQIGHLEAAAGIASFIKAVLCVQRGEVPGTRLPEDAQLSPLVPWRRMCMRVPRASEVWPETRGSTRIAGVSSFGLSGTNIHALVESHESQEPCERTPGMGLEFVVVSAKHADRLHAQCARLLGSLESLDECEVPSFCHTLRCGRTQFAHRIAGVVTSKAQLQQLLREGMQTAASGPESGVPVLRTVQIRGLGDAQDANGRLLAHLRAWNDKIADALSNLDASTALSRLFERFGLRARDSKTPASTGEGIEIELGDRVHVLRCGEDETGSVQHFLAFLRAAFLQGATLDLSMLRAPGASLLSSVPTYPFKKSSYWIPEPEPATERNEGVRAPQPGRVLGDDARSTTRAVVLEQLQSLLEPGFQIDVQASFFDNGGDSFKAMVFKSSLEQHLNVEIDLEQMGLEQSIEDIVTHIHDLVMSSARGEA